MSVLDEIRAERARQDEQWGGPEHDDSLTLDTWWGFLEKHWDKLDYAFGALEEAEAVAMNTRPSTPISPEALRRLRHRAIVVAALMVALIESNDRSYDGPAGTL